MKRIWFMGALLCVLLIMASCSSSDNSDSSANYDSNDAGYAEGNSEETVSNNAAYDQKMEFSKEGASASDNQAGSNDSSLGALEGDEGFSRMLIYKANLTMRVQSYQDAQSKLQDMIHLSDGYLVSFQESRSDHELGGTYVIKIPASGFNSFLDELETIDPLTMERRIEGQDVTEEYVDLSARLKAKQVVEERLLSFMDEAQRADDLVSFSNELGRVQEEIERLKGRMRFLDQNVAYSTVELRIYERTDGNALMLTEDQNLFERAWQAMKSSTTFLWQFLQAVLVFIAGALPVLLVLAIVGVPITFWLLRRSTAGPQNSSDQEQKQE